MKILMVCLGNICRSPLAEGIMRHLVNEQNLDWQISSAGTGDWHVNQPADKRSIAAAKRFGYDISKQRAKHFNKQMFDSFDHILVMDRHNLRDVLKLAENEQQRKKVKLFLADNNEVTDPYYDDNLFEPVLLEIEQRCRQLIEEFKVPKLFMLLLGCTPYGRHTEQHDVFFAVGNSLKDLKEEIIAFWPEANGKIHIDAWREVTTVDGYKIEVVNRHSKPLGTNDKLFFLNLGGYKKGEFDEFHYKMLTIAEGKAAAIKRAKETTFYKHTGFEGAVSHIDDKYGVDIDDAFDIEEVLPVHFKRTYKLALSFAPELPKDEVHIGYLVLNKL